MRTTHLLSFDVVTSFWVCLIFLLHVLIELTYCHMPSSVNGSMNCYIVWYHLCIQYYYKIVDKNNKINEIAFMFEQFIILCLSHSLTVSVHAKKIPCAHLLYLSLHFLDIKVHKCSKLLVIWYPSIRNYHPTGKNFKENLPLYEVIQKQICKGIYSPTM
jgi:hypothetical protein